MAWNSTQHSIITYLENESRKEWISRVAEQLCYTPEINI